MTNTPPCTMNERAMTVPVSTSPTPGFTSVTSIVSAYVTSISASVHAWFVRACGSADLDTNNKPGRYRAGPSHNLHHLTDGKPCAASGYTTSGGVRPRTVGHSLLRKTEPDGIATGR